MREHNWKPTKMSQKVDRSTRNTKLFQFNHMIIPWE